MSDLLNRLLGRKEPPRRSPIVEAIIMGEIIGESVSKSIKNLPPPQPLDIDIKVPSIAALQQPPERIVQQLPQQWERRVRTYFSEKFTPSKDREVIYTYSAPNDVILRNLVLIDYTMHSASASYSVAIRRDGATLYGGQVMTHEEWRTVSAQLSKINAYQEAGAGGAYVWGAYDIPFKRTISVIIADSTDVEFDKVMATVEYEELI